MVYMIESYQVRWVMEGVTINTNIRPSGWWFFGTRTIERESWYQFWFATYQTSYNLQGDFENHKHLSLLSVFSGRMVFVIFIKSLNIVSIVLYLLHTHNICRHPICMPHLKFWDDFYLVIGWDLQFIEHNLASLKKLCFLDITAAFDSVWHNV